MGKSVKKENATKVITRYTLIATILLFVWYVLSDRLTPSTDQARVRV